MPKDNEQIRSRQNWIIGHIGSYSLEKGKLFQKYMRYMLVRCQMIFEYKNLPETIPQKDLEFLLQMNGFCVVTKVNGKLYAFNGGLGGLYNEYYLPTICTVANPYLKFSKELKIGEDCALILNDSYYTGLFPLFETYAYLLAECDISIRCGVINSRIKQLILADTDNGKASADQFMKDIEDGKLGSIMNKKLADGIKTADYQVASSNEIKSLIELRQYLYSYCFIEIGLNANFNMKREAINSSESAIGENALLPLCDNLLEERKLGVERVNKMYGTNITVDFNSAWKKIHEEFCLEDQDQNDKEGSDNEENN